MNVKLTRNQIVLLTEMLHDNIDHILELTDGYETEEWAEGQIEYMKESAKTARILEASIA